MNEVSAAAQRAAKALKDYTEPDVAWVEQRTMTLMLDGVVFVEAVSQAAEECTVRIIKRKLTEPGSVLPAPEARGGKSQQPTLKASFGDLLAARRRA